MLDDVRNCFENKLTIYGATPEGVYWNSVNAQEVRFAQLFKIIDHSDRFSLLDYGCGYGALTWYLDCKRCDYSYTGFDISVAMISEGRKLAGDKGDRQFISEEHLLEPADYVVESGIFNLKLDACNDAWTDYVLRTLDRMNELSLKGMAFNMLTTYSDSERMRADLYYGDPCFFFDYCKRNYSCNVALLHDYEIYDFTILVRK